MVDVQWTWLVSMIEATDWDVFCVRKYQAPRVMISTVMARVRPVISTNKSPHL